jgi:hypothetical protein
MLCCDAAHPVDDDANQKTLLGGGSVVSLLNAAT